MFEIWKDIAKCYPKKVYQYTMDGKLVNIFNSTNEVARKTLFDQSGIVRCCNGMFKQYKGYIWRYKEWI